LVTQFFFQKEKITLNEANDELDRIIAAPDRYNWALDLICYIVSSGAIAPLFFGGGVKEMLLSAVMGLMVGLFCILSGFWAPFGGLLELVSAFLVSFIAGLFSFIVEPICTFGTTLSGTHNTTHYTLHTAHYTLHTTHYTQHTTHNTQYLPTHYTYLHTTHLTSSNRGGVVAARIDVNDSDARTRSKEFCLGDCANVFGLPDILKVGVRYGSGVETRALYRPK